MLGNVHLNTLGEDFNCLGNLEPQNMAASYYTYVVYFEGLLVTAECTCILACFIINFYI